MVDDVTGAELAKQALLRARDWSGELKTLTPETFNPYNQVRLSAGPVILLLARAVYRLAGEQNEIGSVVDQHQEALEALAGEGEGDGLALEPALADRLMAHLGKIGSMISQSRAFVASNAPEGAERTATLADIDATSAENAALIEAVKAAKAEAEADDGDEAGDDGAPELEDGDDN